MNLYLILGIELLIYMIFWFFVSILKKRNDIADIAWGLGFVLISWSSGFLSGLNIRSLIVNSLVTIWGFRIWRKNIKDERILRSTKEKLTFFFLYRQKVKT